MKVEPVADTVRDTCTRLGIGRTRLYEEIAANRLDARKVGRRTLILRASQDCWLAALPPAASRSSRA